MEQQLNFLGIEVNLQEYKKYLIYDRQLASGTIFGYLHRIRDLQDFLQKRQLSTVTKEDIRAFIMFLENRKLSKGGICNYITAFRSFFNWLTDSNKTENILSVSFFLSRIVKIKRSRKIPVVPTVEEISKLRKTLEAHRRAFSFTTDTNFYKTILREIATIELLITTGIRSNELRNLKYCDVDMKKKIIYIRKGKGNQQRMSLFSDSAHKALERYFQNNPLSADDLIFPYRQGNILNYIIKRWARRAGINEKLHTHSFRHYFITEAQRQGVRIVAVAEQVGHRDLNTTRNYTHHNFEYLKKQFQNVEI